MKTAEVRWIEAAEELPDDEMTVLMHLEGGEVWTGFHEDGQWHYIGAETVRSKVLHWAEYPEPPQS